VQESGFSHGFGALDANRELVEWMRQYNADPGHPTPLHFYGFDSPTEMTGSDSPRHVLRFVLEYLSVVDPASADEHRERIEPLLGRDADWESFAALMDPTQSVGRSDAANALRIATEDLIITLQIWRPEYVARSSADRYREALQYASVARQLLNYHATMAQESAGRVTELLGIRDAMMADILTGIVAREQGRGRVLAFAHNSHLQRGMAQMQLGPMVSVWWPAGSHLAEMLGPRYAAIGSALALSDANGIGRPDVGTFEARLTATPGPGRFIPTHKGAGLPTEEIATIPVRSGSAKNPTYFPLTPRSLTDFDGLMLLDTATYSRGGPPLQTWDADAEQ
jgi:erythromycin esterase